MPNTLGNRHDDEVTNTKCFGIFDAFCDTYSFRDIVDMEVKEKDFINERRPLVIGHGEWGRNHKKLCSICSWYASPNP